MQIEIDIECKCQECGNSVSFDQKDKRNMQLLTIELCSKCITETSDKANEIGYKSGYNDAEKEIQITLDDAESAVKKYLKLQNLTNILTDIQVEEIAKSMGYS